MRAVILATMLGLGLLAVWWLTQSSVSAIDPGVIVLAPPQVPAKSATTAISLTATAAQTAPEVPTASPGDGRVASQPTGESRPVPPASLSGFWSWTDARREQIVTLLAKDASWSPEVHQFVRNAVRVRELSLVTRNNMANGLIRQPAADPELERLFVAMAQDVNESPAWRGYAVQFIAHVFPKAVDRPALERVLKDMVATADDLRAATAALQLSHLHTAGLVQLDAAFDLQLLVMAQDQQRSVADRATFLAMCGERRVSGALELARRLVLPEHAGDLRRAALGVLGRMGTAADRPLVEGLISDPDPAVGRTAQMTLSALHTSTH